MRSQVKQPNHMLELWIDGVLIGEFRTFELMIEHLAEFYPKAT